MLFFTKNKYFTPSNEGYITKNKEIYCLNATNVCVIKNPFYGLKLHIPK